MRPSGSLCGCGPEIVPLTDRPNSRPRITFASRSARLPLHSHAKQRRFQTSAWPSPPVSFRAPCLKQYQPPAGSASVGVGSPSGRHGAMKCDCAAQGSFNSDARHLAMNSPGVILAGICRYALPAPAYTRPRIGDFHARYGEVPNVQGGHGRSFGAHNGRNLTIRSGDRVSCSMAGRSNLGIGTCCGNYNSTPPSGLNSS